MTPAPAPVKPPAQLVRCGLGCRYAEPLRGEYLEWIWCTRPAATKRVHSIDSDCHWFMPAALPDASKAR